MVMKTMMDAPTSMTNSKASIACALGVLSLVLWSCTPQGDPAIGDGGFRDDFNRQVMGALWTDTGGGYRLRDGQLIVQGARNRPLWLRRTLPRDVRVEFDARSDSGEGDIKVEIFGDGASKATTDSYTATSYVVIFGGWGNSKNVIARLDEHGPDRVEGPFFPVEKGKMHHFVIERRAGVLTVQVDGKPFGELRDRAPLYGKGHDHFAFNNWKSPLIFDNLSIVSLR